MERRQFLQLLCVGMGMVLATKPTKAITLVAPPLTQTDSGSGPTPETSVAKSEDMDPAQVEKAYYGHWRRVKGTGSSSASRSASHSLAAAPWHLGQCRLRQLLWAMIVCAQPSQRATCPPSAAVRQRSIADITFIWPRLTRPALARCHAAPKSRKMSATSRAGRDTSAARYASSWSLGRSFLPFLGLLRGAESGSSGLSTLAIMPVATRV
jgi:hypothetical protein